MAKSLLAEYKRHIRQIGAKKGTGAWLREFARWFCGCADGIRLLRFYKLTPQEFYHLRYIARQLANGECAGFIETGIYEFLGQNGFAVESHDIGYTAREGVR